MGKPRGNYVTLEAPGMSEQDEGYHREVSEQLAKILKRILPKKTKPIATLVVGLGNREITPDALGPQVVDNLMITRHVIKEYGKYAFGEEEVNLISSIVPGVMAQTGMESLEILRGIIKETKPDCIIAVDALAARSTKRLSRTIQITDTGINPGSGVGNHRHGLCAQSVGIPVIAIGIPTVIDAATIVYDAMDSLITALNDAEKYDLAKELVAPNLNAMFVTPKDIDESIKRLSFTISEGLNLALS
jgi:spore protease